MDYTPRKVKNGELNKLLNLYKYLHSDDENIITDSMTESWDQIIKNDNFFRYFVIEDKNEFIASCCIAIIPNLTRNGISYALIENVMTHPDYRRKGLGRSVVEKAINYAKDKNCYKVMLLSNSDRKEAHQFYLSLGFDPDAKVGFLKKL